ncbi:hypothetical protein [Deinococcus roseus]|uniref:HD domain-containing protein n=1 Tax=Deinococcus roseus TaxID=392414 RepID=A0ABQ2CUS9_9DEIO|nr:hypothetical protein [Deinococcus roseus]GGJ19534.1 hypothetical protein GCM10008938_02060 [Deinococcus roseus]
MHLSSNFPGLHAFILEQFELPLTSIHGPSHWARVERIGQRLAQHSTADPVVLELFSLLHDSRRTNDGWDLEHGPEAAQAMVKWRGTHFDCSDDQFNLLQYAVQHHTTGRPTPMVTIGACWDSDRLDLMRVGIRPDPGYLSLPHSREPETLLWAINQSLQEMYPGTKEITRL